MKKNPGRFRETARKKNTNDEKKLFQFLLTAGNNNLLMSRAVFIAAIRYPPFPVIRRKQYRIISKSVPLWQQQFSFIWK